MDGPFGLGTPATIGRTGIGKIEKVSYLLTLIRHSRSCIAVLIAASRTRLERFWAACSHLAALSSVQAIRLRPDAGNNSARIAVWRPRAPARLASLVLITGREGDFASAAVPRPKRRHNGRLTTAWLRFDGFRAHFDAMKTCHEPTPRSAARFVRGLEYGGRCAFGVSC